ncbi:MAG TPA: bifunctional DNA primase/polymerase [bacterium]|nr:bifunctional DNA primase/polymerase [bacterium]
MTAADNPLLAAALAYAARGWHVFPCAPGGKAPITPHGLKDATTDAEQILTWWAAEPAANVAVAAGRSGLLIVDCDGAEGIGTFAAWADAHDRPLGDVPCAATPRGGRHYYFAAGDSPAVA